jgi:hypothetical protein
MKPAEGDGEIDFFDLARQIKRSDLSELDKVTKLFGHITGSIIEHSRAEMELARAMYDKESLIKHQVKLETLKYARGVFAECYNMMSGREAWDGEES